MYDGHILFKEHLPNKIFKKILSFYKSPNYNRHCIICYAKMFLPILHMLVYTNINIYMNI